MPCARMAGQVAKGATFTFPRSTTVCDLHGLSRPCSPRAGPKGSDCRAASLQKRGMSVFSAPSPPGLKEFHPLPLDVCLPGLQLRHLPSPGHLAHRARPSTGSLSTISLKRPLLQASSQCSHQRGLPAWGRGGVPLLP